MQIRDQCRYLLRLQKKKWKLDRLVEELKKLVTKKAEREESKNISLDSSKRDYLDPRIVVARCKKFKVGIESAP